MKPLKLGSIAGVAVSLLVWGCGDDFSAQTLTSAQNLPAGSAECPKGGIVLHQGVDGDKNGSLEDDEIESSQTVCNGAQYDTLVRRTPLANGDDRCPFGGSLIEVGVDDGADGGTAGNGVLEDGEVDATSTDCNGQGIVDPPSLTPPEGPAGTSRFDLSGGEGSTTAGGSGGFFQVQTDSHIGFFATGSVDVSFTVPENEIDLGSDGASISSNTTLALDPAAPTNNQIYMKAGVSRLFRWDQPNATEVEVTGLHVAAGATVTLPGNFNAGDTVQLDFDNDVHIAGTLTTAFSGNDRADLELEAENFRLEEDGLVALSANTAVQSPGYFEAYFDGSMVVLGELNVSGGPDDPGASVYVEADGLVVVAGTVDASGSTASPAGAGNGGSIELLSQIGTRISGTLDVDGGVGTTTAGSGGSIVLSDTNGPGLPGIGAKPVLVSGTLTAHGGSCAEAAVNCAGGSGGSIQLSTADGNVHVSGDLLVQGTDGKAGNGGSGGSIAIQAGGGGPTYQIPDSGTDFRFSGDILVHGGDGQQAGSGGSISIQTGLAQEVLFFGYSSLELHGGNGETNGGSGGVLVALNGFGQSHVAAMAAHLEINASGGEGETAGGGEGGTVYFLVNIGGSTYGGGLFPNLEHPSLVLGEQVDVSGGDGISSGGDAGFIGVNDPGTMAPDAVSLSGDLLATGGSSRDDSGGGGDGGRIAMYTSGALTCESPTINVDGGSGENADDAGVVALVGKTVESASAISAKGGDSAGVGNDGGDGGEVGFLSADGDTAISGSNDVSAGNGDPDGEAGRVWIDHVDVLSL